MKSAHSFFVLLLFFTIPFSAVSQTANSPTITSDQNLAIAVKDYCHRQALDKLFTEVPAQALPVRPLYQSLAAAKHEGDPLPSPLPFSLESFFVAEGNASVQPICIDHLSPRHFASDIVLRLVVEGAGVILKVYPIPPTEEDNEAIYAVTVRPGTTASSARSALFYQIFTKPRDEETPFAPAGAVQTIELPEKLQFGKLEFIIHIPSTKTLAWIGGIWESSATGKGVMFTLEAVKPPAKTAEK